MITPSRFGFSAEFQGDHPAYDDFDEYLRVEFAKRHPGWEPRFGRTSWFDATANRYDYTYLLHGNVPDAESHEDAEHKVRQLVEEISHGLKSLKTAIERPLPRPRVRVWRW